MIAMLVTLAAVVCSRGAPCVAAAHSEPHMFAKHFTAQPEGVAITQHAPEDRYGHSVTRHLPECKARREVTTHPEERAARCAGMQHPPARAASYTVAAAFGSGFATAEPAPARAQASGPDAAPPLTAAQRAAILHVREMAKKRAAPAAARLAAIVNRIYDNVLADKPDEHLRQALGTQMKDAAWQLLSVKGDSIRATVEVLNREQKRRVKDEMRKPGAPQDLSEIVARVFGLPDEGEGAAAPVPHQP